MDLESEVSIIQSSSIGHFIPIIPRFLPHYYCNLQYYSTLSRVVRSAPQLLYTQPDTPTSIEIVMVDDDNNNNKYYYDDDDNDPRLHNPSLP